MGLTNRERNNRPQRRDISHEEFIKAWGKAWRNGGSIDDVAKDLGTSRGHAYSRADWLRKAGVKLPNFKNRQWLSDDYIDELNNLAEKEIED